MGRPVISEIGKQYGRLTVLSRAETDKHRQALWLCRCDCGNVITVCGVGLRRGNNRSCGCLKAIDEVNHQYGKLTVLSRVGTNKGGAATWLCHCDCGNEIVICGADLRRGMSQSCGCLRNEKTRGRNILRTLPFGEASFNSLVCRMQRSAKQRGYSWQLTKDQVRKLTSKPCYYCGIEPAQRGISAAGHNGTYIYNGLDRIDNEHGYEIDNVVPCCGTCNLAKRARTQNEFLAWISRVYKYTMLKEQDEALP